MALAGRREAQATAAPSCRTASWCSAPAFATATSPRCARPPRGRGLGTRTGIWHQECVACSARAHTLPGLRFAARPQRCACDSARRTAHHTPRAARSKVEQQEVDQLSNALESMKLARCWDCEACAPAPLTPWPGNVEDGSDAQPCFTPSEFGGVRCVREAAHILVCKCWHLLGPYILVLKFGASTILLCPRCVAPDCERPGGHAAQTRTRREQRPSGCLHGHDRRHRNEGHVQGRRRRRVRVSARPSARPTQRRCLSPA